MKKNHLLFRLLIISVAPFSCGRPPSHHSVTKRAHLSSLDEDKRSGTAYLGKECVLELDQDQAGRITRLRLAEEFKVDYKIPAPFSGLRGIYYWSATFDTKFHLAEAPLQVKRSWLNDADVIEGKGVPLFWNTGTHHHKIVVKPSLQNPQSLTYHSTEYVLGGIPFVVIDGICTFS